MKQLSVSDTLAAVYCCDVTVTRTHGIQKMRPKQSITLFLVVVDFFNFFLSKHVRNVLTEIVFLKTAMEYNKNVDKTKQYHITLHLTFPKC